LFRYCFIKCGASSQKVTDLHSGDRWRHLESVLLSACSLSAQAFTHQGEVSAAQDRVTEDIKEAK